MIYLHEAPYDETLIRHWANEISENNDEEFEKATYKIKQVETDIIYDEAVDAIPCRYTYEATDLPIEQPEVEAVH